MQELYQSEEFQPLVKFLDSCITQLSSELFSLDYTSEKATIQAARLTAQINLVGTLLKLPAMIQELKKKVDEYEEEKQKRAAQNYDPLNNFEYKGVKDA